MIRSQSFRGLLVLLIVPLAASCDPATSTGPASKEGVLVAQPARAGGGQSESMALRVRADGAVLQQRFAPGFPGGRSTFEGRCSVPSDFVIRFSIAGPARLGQQTGRITGVLEHCTLIDFQTGLSSYGDGDMSLTFSGGDRLYASYQGGDGPTGGFRDEVEFSGGTGRFVGATGRAVATGACDRATGTCRYDLAGAISYDAADR